MAQVGDVFRFVSNQVLGNSAKPKFHVAIDLNCGFFLFINSDPNSGAMEIDQSDWPTMPKQVSYISCNAGVRYRRADFHGVSIQPAGALSRPCLKRLRQHIHESFVMPQVDIDLAIAALDSALSG